MPFRYDSSLPELLKRIEQYMVSNLPAIVAKRKVDEPVYALFLWYFDSSICDGFAPTYGLGLDSYRKACAERNDDFQEFCNRVWMPNQNSIVNPPGGEFNDRTFRDDCDRAYALMLAANTTGLPLADESELLLPFREMMYRLALRMNEFDWSDTIARTDDFVVVAAECNGYWLLEDMKKSMPIERFKMLRNRNVIW